ncbi:VOC family protein [Agrococcus sp. SL85]|uniref:VOC family protein n=1 Tax=Agrococcus sp. SL85 TaxID=2995141 RepID=UPI00226C8FA1|nr:VOC family protein [Agrococcus sp. SL85]WAC66557.1 VOC family protein [Agrococcus sp. SL85]
MASDHPVQARIGAVFVPVSDIARSAAWYGALLGVPVGTTSHEDRIHDVPLAGEAALILDAHRPVAVSSQPLCFLWSDDLERAAALVEDLGGRPSAIEDIGSVRTMRLEDPDGNLLMLCQRT